MFLQQKTLEIYADTSYDAHQKAVAEFKASKRNAHMATVILCEKATEQVVHSTTQI